MVIKGLLNGKCLGPDGFTNSYYCKFLPLLSSPIPKEALLAHIMVLPKEGKDPAAPNSYRPISLLNTDMKILAWILANRLKTILPTVIYPDQTVFIAGVARDNLNRALQLIH